MSQKRKIGLSREELELHHLLSPSNSQSTISVTAGHTLNAEGPPPPPVGSLSTECMQDFASILTRSIVTALKATDSQEMSDSSGQEDGEDGTIDNELPTGRPFVELSDSALLWCWGK